ncbi:MAG: hypothetical protein D6758_11915 [Gammaproteobacteria bacterium]|nr:MAG: hypothetical protein D6758_11915 [Gammaproteobacteria bacterium]
MERTLTRLLRERDQRATVEPRSEARERRTTPTRARYLTDITLRYPDAALQAALNETRFLRDQTFQLVGKTLQPDLPEAQRLTPDAFETAYSLNVREVYNDLLTQLPRIRTELNLSPEQAEALARLREAAKELIEACKNTKHLLKHYWEGLHHGAPAVRQFYAGFASLIQTSVETLQRLSALHDDEAFELECDRLMVRLEEADLFRSGQLDEAIAAGRVPREWIAALTHDNHYVQALCRRLLFAVRTLHHVTSEGYSDTHDALQLNAEDMDSLIDSSSTTSGKSSS